jgi:ketosteroid isomerase-like protein
MMDRASIESLVRDAYAARLRGDVEGACAHFADDAQFALAGAETSPVAVRCSDCETLRKVMSGLVAAFEFKDHEILSLIVEGPKAAVHSRALVRATGTGQEAWTEFADLVTVRDGKIASFVQFCDTALAARMMNA